MKILTFDIEEWYHLLDNASTKTEKEWSKYEIRIHENTDRILEILDKTNTKASFLVVGWIAERYPEIVKRIVDCGYEVGSHTYMHQLVHEMGADVFERDLERSLKTLEDITGQKVKYFRAPGFSITDKTKWAFDCMVKYGVEIDCSMFPGHHAHGGFPSINQAVPSIIRYNGISLKEFPINYVNFLGRNVVFSGGGYFRLFPYFMTKKWTTESEYLMSYLHPRDFDANQPMIEGLSVVRKFKSYWGLNTAANKLEKWLSDFNFIDIAEADRKIDWDKVPVLEM